MTNRDDKRTAKRAWTAPALARLNAAGAELLVAIVDDGPGDHS